MGSLVWLFLVLSATEGFVCPPMPVSVQGVNQQCGGTCHSAGKCASGLVCQAQCKDTRQYTGVVSDVDIYTVGSASATVGRCAPANMAADAAAHDACAGCAVSVSVCEKQVVDATEFAIRAIDEQSNSLNSLQLVRPVKATSQVVAGVKYQLTFMAGVSECAKSLDGTPPPLCSTPVHASAAHEYRATVWDRPWRTPRYVLQHWELPQAAHTCNCPPSMAVYSCSLAAFEQLSASCAASATTAAPAATDSSAALTDPPQTRCYGCPKPARADDAAVLRAVHAALGLVTAIKSPAELLSADIGSGIPAVLQTVSPSMQVLNATVQTVSGRMFHAWVLLSKPLNPPPTPHAGIGPAWTWSNMEKPGGVKDMGSWQERVYTPEQQARLGVNGAGITQAAVSLCELQVWQRSWQTPQFSLRRFNCLPAQGKEVDVGETTSIPNLTTKFSVIQPDNNEHNSHGADSFTDYNKVVGFTVGGCAAAAILATMFVNYRSRVNSLHGMSRHGDDQPENDHAHAETASNELVVCPRPTRHEQTSLV